MPLRFESLMPYTQNSENFSCIEKSNVKFYVWDQNSNVKFVFFFLKTLSLLKSCVIGLNINVKKQNCDINKKLTSLLFLPLIEIPVMSITE
jgi:hypothetical protein